MLENSYAVPTRELANENLPVIKIIKTLTIATIEIETEPAENISNEICFLLGISDFMI